MRTPFHGTYQDDLTREVIVVNFAGGGGSCVGIEQALVRANCADMAVDYARKGGRADTMEELHRVFGGYYPRDRRPARVAV